MIAKHVLMKSAQKSDFAGLVAYITGPQGKHERVGDIRVSNCHSDRAEVAMLEVLNTQAQNTRSAADKTYHLIISFRADEQPERETLETIEERICNGLGFAGHQRVSVVHHDTDNLHLHIAINKIHPSRYTIHEPFNAYHTLAQVCDRLERDYGLQRDNHKASKGPGENRAADMEQHAALESLLSWIRRECKEQMQGAQSWHGLHHIMREHGLQIQQRGNGFVIANDDGTCVKASSVAREFSKAALEARLGSFEPDTQAIKVPSGKSYAKRPLGLDRDTVELYARYTSAQKNLTSERATEWTNAAARKTRLLEGAKHKGRLKRAAIKLVSAPRTAKKLMYAATSKTLREEIAAINRQYRGERQAIFEKHRRLTWADWLRRQATAGEAEALEALRARKPKARHTANTMSGTSHYAGSDVSGGHDSVTKRGTVIYRCGAGAIRDDGQSLKVSRGADRAGLEAALRMAIARYGTRIAVNGSEEFKQQIVLAAVAAHLTVSFDDDALEHRHRSLADSLKTKESKHDRNKGKQGNRNRGRSDRSRDGGHRAAAARRAAAAGYTDAGRRAQHGDLYPHGDLAHAGGLGSEPTPERQDRVRSLSELGVVRDTSGGEVLLPRDVSGDVEHKGSQSVDGVRRPIHRAGGLDRAAVPTQHPDGEKPRVGRAGTAPPPASKDQLRHLAHLGTLIMADSPPFPPTSGSLPSPQVVPVNATATGPDTKRRRTKVLPLATTRAADQPAAPEPSPPAADTQTPSMTGVAISIRIAPKRPGVAMESAGLLAARKYVIEREQKRVNGFDIPKHALYTEIIDLSFDYAGMRHVDGQPLALLKVDDEVRVLPIDEATARRLKRVSPGQQITVSAKGSIRTKGRSR